MPKLAVKEVATGNTVDMILLDREGQLHARGDLARDLIRSQMEMGFDPKEAFDRLKGWSNGYLKIE